MPNFLKRKAKSLGKASVISHTAALNLVAKDNGYESWDNLVKNKKAETHPKVVIRRPKVPDPAILNYRDTRTGAILGQHPNKKMSVRKHAKVGSLLQDLIKTHPVNFARKATGHDELRLSCGNLVLVIMQDTPELFEESFKKHYREDFGRPAKPIRLMVALLMLKHIRNLSDESVVEQWSENAYYQHFSGEQLFTAKVPCEASELVHFRNRIGSEGVELILKESIRINGKGGKEDKGSIDTTVQEKNITYPTDSKLHRKIIKKCVGIAGKAGIELRQSYTRTLKRPGVDQRFRNHPKNGAKAHRADKKVKTIAGRLVRELGRKLPAENYQTELELFERVLRQKRQDKNKVYSLHEPEVLCISKGKEHKKYEFGSKVSITVTQKSGVIIGALNIPGNDYDGHTLDAALEQQQRLTGHKLKEAFVDKGLPGKERGTGNYYPYPQNIQQQTNRLS